MLPLKCVYQPYVELSEKKKRVKRRSCTVCNALFIDCILDRLPQFGCLVLQHACVDVAPIDILENCIAIAAIRRRGRWLYCLNRFWERGEFFASLHPRAVQVNFSSQRTQLSLHRHSRGTVRSSLYSQANFPGVEGDNGEMPIIFESAPATLCRLTWPQVT